MNAITRRIAAGAALAIAPALIALGGATASYAAPSATDRGPSVHAPTHHEPFPHQAKIKPGTPEHHKHQKHRH